MDETNPDTETLRDRLAMAALNALLAASIPHKTPAAHVALAAYNVADAMLARRKMEAK